MILGQIQIGIDRRVGLHADDCRGPTRAETFGGIQIFSFEGIAFYRIFSLIYEAEFFYRHVDFSDSYYKDQGHF